MSPKWLLFFTTITAIIITSAYAGLREISISNLSSVNERATRSILELCYDGDNSSDAIVVVGDFNEFTDKLPMIRIDSKNPGNYPFLNFKLTKVVISINSAEQLEVYIQLLKDLRIWNHMALFFIVSKLSCWKMTEIFRLTYNANMINSIYICSGILETPVLNTVNQYADYAPHPWKFINEFPQFALFSQQFDKNVSCSSLNYDKTKKLTRHVIRILESWPLHTYFDPEMNYWPKLTDAALQLKIFYHIVRQLNTSVVLNIRSGKDAIIELIQGGLADVAFHVFHLQEYPTVKNFFPHYYSRIVAIIKLSSEKTTQNKILHLWSGPVIFLAFTAQVILFLILFWKRREFSSTLLDLIRLIIYSSILTNINSNSFRIFFSTILIMMIISNGVFQSKIAAFLTTRERNKPIERIETLLNMGYDLYTCPMIEPFIRINYPEYKIRIVEMADCLRYASKDRYAACLTEEVVYRLWAHRSVDLVREPLLHTSLVIKSRDDWPLYDRINVMWMRIFESGLVINFVKNYTDKPLHKRQIQDYERLSTQYQPIKLYKLLFAFQFLAIGLSFSTIVFIVELLVKKYGNST